MDAAPRLELRIRSITSQPTTSYFERFVARAIRGQLGSAGITVDRDQWGNLHAEIVTDPKAQPVAFVAHMDHPGIEAVSQTKARLHGGVKVEYFAEPVPVWIYPSEDPGFCVEGIVSNIVENPADPDDTLLDLETDYDVAGAFGVWGLPNFVAGPVADGDATLHMRAADDLAGCAVVVETLVRLAEKGGSLNVHALFTRAEETGLCGATLVGREGRWLPRDAIVVSVETSKALPGAEIGKGAVIRVGDASSVFGSRAELQLKRAAKELREDDNLFVFQRQLMSGGVCEASSFMLFGYETIGIALPLGNYHNMGPDGKLAMEYISASDAEGAVMMGVRLVDTADDDSITDAPAAAWLAKLAEANEARLLETADRI